MITLTQEQEELAAKAGELLVAIAKEIEVASAKDKRVVVCLRVNHALKFSPTLHYVPTPEWRVEFEFDSCTKTSDSLRGAINTFSGMTEKDRSLKDVVRNAQNLRSQLREASR